MTDLYNALESTKPGEIVAGEGHAGRAEHRVFKVKLVEAPPQNQ